MPKFLTETPTTQYKDIASVMVECDYNEENHPELGDQTLLTRLHHRMQQGEMLDDNDRETVRTLEKSLGVVSEKWFSLSGDNYPQVLRAAGYRNHGYPRIALTRPLGLYYTKITVPYHILAFPCKEALQVWDNQPIEECEIAMVPNTATASVIQSHRVARCQTVCLHFAGIGFATLFTLLSGLSLNCTTLELRNAGLSVSEYNVLKVRLRWPYLRNIILSEKK